MLDHKGWICSSFLCNTVSYHTLFHVLAFLSHSFTVYDHVLTGHMFCPYLQGNNEL